MKDELYLNQIDSQTMEVPTIQVQINSSGNSLSGTQMRVLEQILAGKSNKEIATRVSLSEQGIKYHVSILLKMFSVRNRAHLRNKIIQMKIASQF